MLLKSLKSIQIQFTAISLTISVLCSCSRNRNNPDIQKNSFVIYGETLTLSSDTPSYLLKRDAKVTSVYKITENNHITIYKPGIDYILTNNGGIQRTLQSSIPDFSKYIVPLNSEGKFTFIPDPNRNPKVTISWQVMANYTTSIDSVIIKKSDFLSKRLQNKIKAKQDISLYCIGTSISAGAHTTSVFYDNKNTNVYVQLIAKTIKRLYGNRVTITNLSEGGATTELFSAKLKEIESNQPDLIFVEFGMNEHINALSMDKYLNSIENNIKSLLAKGIDCSLLGFFQQNPQWELEDPISTIYFNNKLQDIAARNRIFFADIYNSFGKLPKERIYKDFLGDYMHHPTDFGHKLYYLTTVPLILFEDKKESQLWEIANAFNRD